MDTLPIEIIAYIVMFMEFKTVKAFALTCKMNHSIVAREMMHIIREFRKKFCDEQCSLERIYYLNGYIGRTKMLDGIIIQKKQQSITWQKMINVPIWYIHDDKPSKILSNITTGQFIETWTFGGYHHRDDGPAVEKWHGNQFIQQWYNYNKCYRELQWTDGQITKETWFMDNKVHRLDGPAMTIWKNGQKIRELWCLNDLKHRLDKPAFVEFFDNQMICEAYLKNDEFHRTDGPAVITWSSKGAKTSEAWIVNGKFHRNNAPALTTWNDGQKTKEVWLIDDKKHRIDGPAITLWKDGQKIEEQWICRNQIYRLNGPASTQWAHDYMTEKWYESGVKTRTVVTFGYQKNEN